MPYPDVRYTNEALSRMAERAIGEEAVAAVLRGGFVLRRYPEDKPRPSYLIMGWAPEDAELGTYPEGRPVHVVAADFDDGAFTRVVTTYEPDPAQWEDGFRWRKAWKSTANTWRESP